MGWYNTRACLFAMGYQKPLWAAAHGKGNVREHHAQPATLCDWVLCCQDVGVVYALAATIGYEDCICTFDCGFETFGRNWLEISGTDGGINVSAETVGLGR